METHAQILAMSNAVGATVRVTVPTHQLMGALMLEVSVGQSSQRIALHYVQLHAMMEKLYVQEEWTFRVVHFQVIARRHTVTAQPFAL